MKSLVRWMVFGVLFATGVWASAKEKKGELPTSGGMAEALRPFVDEELIPGAVVLVTDKDRVLDLETIGYADRSTDRPMRDDDLFYIASMTKCFTSAALMMLVDEGKVNVNDPVEKYLPEFKGQMVEEEGTTTGPHLPRHPMTLEEAMDHTAGLEGEPSPRRFTLKEEVEGIAKSKLRWEPGTKFDYSIGLEIAGRVIEVVSGIPYTQFVQQRLLDPLGMKDTTFWPNAEQASHLAFAHEIDAETKRYLPLRLNPDLIDDPSKCGGVPPVILSQFPASFIPSYANHFARASGSLFSTAPDIAKLCRMVLNEGTYQGKTYLSPAAVKLMTSMHTGDVVVGNGRNGYGLGFFVQKKPTNGGVSVGSFGHHGSRKTQLWIDPTNGIAMVLMVQCTEMSSKDLERLYGAYQKQAVTLFGKHRSKE